MTPNATPIFTFPSPRKLPPLAPPPPGPVVKTCQCGQAYTAETWAVLEFRGLQEILTGNPLELRDCARCESTIAIPVPPVDPRPSDRQLTNPEPSAPSPIGRQETVLVPAQAYASTVASVALVSRVEEVIQSSLEALAAVERATRAARATLAAVRRDLEVAVGR